MTINWEIYVFRELLGMGGFDQSTKEGFCAGIRFRTSLVRFFPGPLVLSLFRGSPFV